MSAILVFNFIVFVLTMFITLYQAVFFVLGLVEKPRVSSSHACDDDNPNASCSGSTSLSRYAIVTCARNEAGVVSEFVDSIRKQNYPQNLLDVYVIADNCSDNTGVVASLAGAKVITRNDLSHTGKSYALDYGIKTIFGTQANQDRYAGIMVFDTDNLVDKDFVREMNDQYHRTGQQIITSYRNSKNFGDSWVSRACSIWFLKESRYLNYPRELSNSSCLIGGTGFFVSTDALRKNGYGWDYHTMTEDIEFAIDNISRGNRIGYCHNAIIYDEQPKDVKNAWRQRLRWSKGFYQVFFSYATRLLRCLWPCQEKRARIDEYHDRAGKARISNRLPYYDALMTISPLMLITFMSMSVNLAWIAISYGTASDYLFSLVSTGFLTSCLGIYCVFAGMAFITVITEHTRIKATKKDMILSVFEFPLLMCMQIPISIQALFASSEWKPIEHSSQVSINQLERRSS